MNECTLIMITEVNETVKADWKKTTGEEHWNGLLLSSLLGCCHGVRCVLPCQCSQAGTPPWCVVSGLAVVCAWDICARLVVWSPARLTELRRPAWSSSSW